MENEGNSLTKGDEEVMEGQLSISEDTANDVLAGMDAIVIYVTLLTVVGVNDMFVCCKNCHIIINN